MLDNQPVKLEVLYEKYGRYVSGGLKKITIKRNSFLEALKVMCDNMSLYLSSASIEEDEMTANDIIESIKSSNGDGCDFIISLKDLLTGKIFIEEDYDEDEER